MAEAAAKHITRGALSAIFTNPDEAKTRFPVPVMQCLQVKPLGAANGAGGERYRVVLSDMDFYVQTMLATQANHVVHDGKLVRGSIVRVKAYQANSVKGKNILIILDLEVIESLGAIDKLGEPVAFDPNAVGGTTNTTTTSTNSTSFYGVKKEEDVKPKMATSNGPTKTNSNHPNVYPIESLSPYSHKWTIKARVTSKSDIRTWHKPSGEGKLFSVNLLDESGEIKATMFNDQCDQFYDVLQEGSVYYISSPCRVNMARKQFSNLSNEYELAFERDTQVEKAEAEDQSSVPQMRFAFVQLRGLQEVEKDATIDVIGILQDVGEASSFTSKNTGKPYEKRELTLVDDSGYSVRMTIWGKTANTFDAKPESVVAFKGVRVSDFGGRSLSLLASGTMSIDPDITEAHHLKGWYDASGRHEHFASHNNMAMAGSSTGRNDQAKTIQQVRDEELGLHEPAYFTLQATIVFIKQETFAYPACSSEGCNRKVVPTGDGSSWRCEKCDRSFPQAVHRYTLMLNATDHTGQLWLTGFDEVGRLVMQGTTADELTALRDDDETGFAAVFERANCRKYNFRVRAKMDTFGDVQRIRYQIQSASPVDFKSDGHKLVELIKQIQVN